MHHCKKGIKHTSIHCMCNRRQCCQKNAREAIQNIVLLSHTKLNIAESAITILEIMLKVDFHINTFGHYNHTRSCGYLA